MVLHEIFRGGVFERVEIELVGVLGPVIPGDLDPQCVRLGPLLSGAGRNHHVACDIGDGHHVLNDAHEAIIGARPGFS